MLGNPFNRGKASPLTTKQFRYAFGNTLSQEESDKIYERYYVPAANSVLFDIAFANLHRNPTAKVDFGKADRAPLLFMATISSSPTRGSGVSSRSEGCAPKLSRVKARITVLSV